MCINSIKFTDKIVAVLKTFRKTFWTAPVLASWCRTPDQLPLCALVFWPIWRYAAVAKILPVVVFAVWWWIIKWYRCCFLLLLAFALGLSLALLPFTFTLYLALVNSFALSWSFRFLFLHFGFLFPVPFVSFPFALTSRPAPPSALQCLA